MDTSSSRSNSTQLLGEALSYECTPSTYPKPVCSLPRDRSYATDWEEITHTPFYHPPTQPGRCCYLVKNRTPRLDFYGLVKKTVPALPHLVSAPAWPRAAAGAALYKFSGSPRRNVGPGRFMGLALAEALSHGSQPQPSCSPTTHAAEAGTFCVFYLHPSLLSHPINPLFLDALGGQPHGEADPVPPSLSKPPLNS